MGGTEARLVKGRLVGLTSESLRLDLNVEEASFGNLPKVVALTISDLSHVFHDTQGEETDEALIEHERKKGRERRRTL